MASKSIAQPKVDLVVVLDQVFDLKALADAIKDATHGEHEQAFRLAHVASERASGLIASLSAVV